MGILNLFKVIKDQLTGESLQTEEDDLLTDEEWSDNDDNIDEDDDEDDDEAISQEALNLWEETLSAFYSKLSTKELSDQRLTNMIDKIQDEFFEGKIKNPKRTLQKTYENWKNTRNFYKQQAKASRTQTVDMLRRYETLTDEEKASLTDYDGPYDLRKLKKSDGKAVEDIVDSWIANGILDEEKLELMEAIRESEAEEWSPDIHKVTSEDAPLTPQNYNAAKLLFHFNYDCIDLYYKEFADYVKRYWLHSGNQPKPIVCDDLLVNRPCFFSEKLELATPRFHLNKRYFERNDSFQDVAVYLFSDKLEYIAGGGHCEISLADIINLSFNDWSQNDFRRDEIRHWHEVEKGWYGDAHNTEPCPQDAEPDLLEITCRNQQKILFSYGSKHAELIELYGLIYYFIKHPQE